MRSAKIWDGVRDLVSATGLAFALTVSAAQGHDKQVVAVIDVQQVPRDSSAKEEALREKDRDFQARKQWLDAMLSRAVREVQNKLTEVVQVLAEERGPISCWPSRASSR